MKKALFVILLISVPLFLPARESGVLNGGFPQLEYPVSGMPFGLGGVIWVSFSIIERPDKTASSFTRYGLC